jgi:serine phosphatase RsbU (regulator of sigma subunit)
VSLYSTNEVLLDLSQNRLTDMFKTLREFQYSREQIKLLLNSRSGAFAANFFAPIVFVLIYMFQIPLVYLLSWLLLQFLIFLIRIYLRNKGLKAIKKMDRVLIKRYFHYYLISIFLNATLWSVVAILVLLYSDETFLFIYAIVLIGLGAGATSTLGVVFHAVTIFLVNTLFIASVIGIIYARDSIGYTVSILLLIYLFFLLKISHRNHSFIARNIKQKEEIVKSHNLVKESIEYAALIQKALLPKDKVVQYYFKEHFVYLNQRDIVGGDFYSMIPLNDDEVVVLVLDCVGHGVSGAFMTMLTKAIEHQIASEMEQGQLEAKPALILLRFNELLKDMIESNGDTEAIIGFDGAALYVDTKRDIVRYAGARIPLCMIQNNEWHYFKGDRKGIGFPFTPIDQKFTEYELDVSTDTRIYITSDGLLDQIGEDETHYGKERFKTFLLEHYEESFSEQSKKLAQELKRFRGLKSQLDDMIVLGLHLK